MTGTGWICHKCAEAFALSGAVQTWPEWAKFLKNDEHASRRARAHTIVSYDALSADERWPHDRSLGEAWDYIIEDMGGESPEARDNP